MDRHKDRCLDVDTYFSIISNGCKTDKFQVGRGHETVNYTGTQSFILENFDYLIGWFNLAVSQLLNK